jgi:hypothetical protein
LTAAAPIVPVAPALLSTMKGWPNVLVSEGPIVRAMKPVELPGLRQGLDGLEEHRAGDRGHDGRHQSTPRRGQPTGKDVRHVAGARDGIADLLAHGFGHLLRRVDRPRCGDWRDTGELGDVVQGDRAAASPGSTRWSGVAGHDGF